MNLPQKWAQYYVNGVWTLPTRDIRIDGVWTTLDDFAKEHNVDLPDGKHKTKPKKQINTDIEEKGYGDMEQTYSSTSVEEHGDGDSESTE